MFGEVFFTELICYILLQIVIPDKGYQDAPLKPEAAN